MLRKNSVVAALGLALLLLGLTNAAFGQGSTFTYQGRLSDGGAPAAGPYDLQFKLYDGSGNPQGSPNTVTRPGVLVTSGVFTVQLDFGASGFPGADRFLDIAVKKPTDSLFVPLTPRQPLTSTPYALRTFAATSADALSDACTLCVTDAHIQTVKGSKVTGKVANADNASTAENVTGVVQIENGGTGSSTKSFVDLSHNQSIAGRKTFVDPIFADGSQLTNVVNTSTNQTIAGRKIFVDPIFGDGSGLTNVPGTINWQIVSGLSQQALPNTGYLVTNDAQVTITLPESPKEG